MRHQFWMALGARRVNHIKLAYRTGHPLEVKAYIGVIFSAITRSARRAARLRTRDTTDNPAAESKASP